VLVPTNKFAPSVAVIPENRWLICGSEASLELEAIAAGLIEAGSIPAKDVNPSRQKDQSKHGGLEIYIALDVKKYRFRVETAVVEITGIYSAR